MSNVYTTPKEVLDYIESKKVRRREASKKYYQEHREKVLAYMKEWRIRNPDKRYGRDSEKNVAYMRKYYQRNREEILKDKTDYYYRKKAELLRSDAIIYK
jgi:hypothetical protein